jgi:hypothetical protein
MGKRWSVMRYRTLRSVEQTGAYSIGLGLQHGSQKRREAGHHPADHHRCAVYISITDVMLTELMFFSGATLEALTAQQS